jgi:hypothetical protein
MDEEFITAKPLLKGKTRFPDILSIRYAQIGRHSQYGKLGIITTYHKRIMK